ncbi:DUF2189 domain-containing protein [Niveispirillum sp. KHB5.9]|uniref:DUF2189 domain-containing protein n=1 Tax=Niveispirillum sp. KHB5.9 TaxID=3400269 RepID=UPI003A845959
MISPADSLPPTVPPLPHVSPHARGLPAGAAVDWLRAGWRDLWVNPACSLAYGVVMLLVSWSVVAGLVGLERDYFLFPALSGFAIVAPAFATGLYEKSRRLAEGERIGLATMLHVKAASGRQILFVGVLLCLLMLVWMRAAVLLYALFFGWKPFPGLEHVTGMLVSEPLGIWLLLVGGAVGGLFAAFGFAISVFSLPMLLDERVDALTAMGTSMSMVWHNLPVMLTWGAIVLVSLALALLPGLLGLVLVFPLLGHATWHAYQAVRGR